MEYLMLKTKESNEFAAESRQKIETLTRELGRYERLLQEERDKNHDLVKELNEIHQENKY
jgi:hypothetical protein